MNIMKNKIFAAALIVVITVFIAGCDVAMITDCELPQDANYELPQGLLEARIAENTLTLTGLTLVLTNNTERRYYYGNPFRIEKLVGNEWVEPGFIDSVLWTLPAFNLDSGDEVEIEKNWENIYGALEPGTYRIIKSYAYLREPGDFDEYEVYAEFMIEM